MSSPRRNFLMQLFAAGALPALFTHPQAFGALLDPQTAPQVNPDYDPAAAAFWSGFTASTGKSAKPEVIQANKLTTRGSLTTDSTPLFLHHGNDGFKIASQLDQAKMVPQGDVVVSVNTSVVKVGNDDQKTFDRLQNAQLRVDVVQKTSILPMLEAMAYTVVGGMKSAETSAASAKKSSSGAAKKPATTVQSISISSDAAWQKMQNIPLPGGEGRWALNLEAQKKDSLFSKLLENLVKVGGQFVPMIGLPGIAMSALNSFNNLYGVLHAEPVDIIKSNPIRVFATQEAIDSTNASVSEIGGILLQPGTYILMPAGQAPTDSDLQKLTLAQGRIVRAEDAKLTGDSLDEAAADVLKNTTYVTFDVQVKGMTLFSGASKASG